MAAPPNSSEGPSALNSPAPIGSPPSGVSAGGVSSPSGVSPSGALPSGVSPSGTAAGNASGGGGRSGRSRRRGNRSARASWTAGLRTVPGRLRLWTTAAVLAVIGLFAVTSAAFGDAREGLHVMGLEAGPQVVATSALYFALSDMDAQVAEVLLIGREHTLGVGREQSLRLYEQRRAEANRAVRQAAVLAGQDPTAQATVDAVLDGLGRYEQLASRAIVLDEQSGHRAGPPPEQVMRVYREATDLMRLELLPKASNLTLDNAVVVRRTYEDKYAAVRQGQVLTVLVGGLLVAILIGLQLTLTRRFRRLINPPLALATLLAVATAVVAFTVLSEEAEHLRTAKASGFDPTLALSRARAMSHDASADQSRYLLDERWADRYEQVFLDKSKHLLGVGATNTKAYVSALEEALRSYRPGDPAGFVGIYGKEMSALRSPEERDVAAELLRRYRQWQRDDRVMRDLLAQGKRHDAIVFRLGGTPGSTAYDFAQYDQSLVALTEMHRTTFLNRITAGEQALSWSIALPVATIVLVLFIVWGVRPRLAEYR